MRTQLIVWIYREGNLQTICGKERLYLLEPVRDFGALFSARLQIQQRDERLAMLKRYQLIGEMNHHIRNALQVIAWSPYSGLDDRTANISEAVHRIEWTLREVLPEFNHGDDAGSTQHNAPRPNQ